MKIDPEIDWARISVGGLACLCIGLGAWLVAHTPDGTTTAGVGLLLIGSLLAGVWVARS